MGGKEREGKEGEGGKGREEAQARAAGAHTYLKTLVGLAGAA